MEMANKDHSKEHKVVEVFELKIYFKIHLTNQCSKTSK